MRRGRGYFEIRLPNELLDRVKAMMASTGVLDPAEVVSRAVRVYDRALAARDEGDTILVRYKSGSEEELL